MNGLVSPIYTGMLNGKSLRFFKAPFLEPHLPWHAPADLHLCLGMEQNLRSHFQQMLKTSEWAADVRTVATCDGIVTIAPHWMAQGLISLVIQFGRADTSAEWAFENASGEALTALGRNLPPEAFLWFATAAFFNTNGLRPAVGAA